MGITKCEHPYYRVENGRLSCVICGASKAMPKIEDKAQKPSANKSKRKKE